MQPRREGFVAFALNIHAQYVGGLENERRYLVLDAAAAAVRPIATDRRPTKHTGGMRIRTPE
jgi:hypothetical protein